MSWAARIRLASSAADHHVLVAVFLVSRVFPLTPLEPDDATGSSRHLLGGPHVLPHAASSSPDGGIVLEKSLFELEAADFAASRDVALDAAAVSGVAASALAVGERADSGIVLARGDIVLISATSRLTVDCGLGFDIDVGPSGVPGWFGGSASTLPGRGLLAVHGRIGGGAPFPIGESNALLAPGSGALEVTFNQSET